MRKFVIVAILSAFLAIPLKAQDLWVSTHYEVARQQPIVTLVHQTPIYGKWFSNGFVDVWRNPKNGYPANEWSLFSKHWVTRPVTDNLSVSIGMEVLYNRAGVSFQFPKEMNFRPNNPKVYVNPKIGLQYKLY